jgi:hypothetical protein
MYLEEPSILSLHLALERAAEIDSHNCTKVELQNISAKLTRQADNPQVAWKKLFKARDQFFPQTSHFYGPNRTAYRVSRGLVSDQAISIQYGSKAFLTTQPTTTTP